MAVRFIVRHYCSNIEKFTNLPITGKKILRKDIYNCAKDHNKVRDWRNLGNFW